MEMKELFEKFAGATDDVAIYLFGKALQDAIDDKLKTLKPKIEALDCGKYTVDGADRQINVLMKACANLSDVKLLIFGNVADDVKQDFNELITKYDLSVISMG